ALLGQLAEGRGGVAVEDEGDGGAAEALERRARSVGRQPQGRRSAGQPLAPEGEPGLQRLPLELSALPGREVGVLDRQLGERRGRGGPADGESGVQGRQLADQEGHGPAVRHDVVDDQEDRMILRGEPQQGGPQHRPGDEVEGVVGDLARQARGLGLARRAGEPGEVDRGERRRERGGDLLHGLAVHLAEDGAERLVAADDLGQGVAERRHVEVPGQAHPLREIERRVRRVEPVEEPEPPLAEGEGRRAGVGAAGDLRPRRGLDPLLLQQLLEQQAALLGELVTHRHAGLLSSAPAASAASASASSIASTSSSDRLASRAITAAVFSTLSLRSGSARIAATTPATVGDSKTWRSWRSMSNARRMRVMTWVAESEWPPSSKKSSSTPTRSTPRTPAQIPATISSTGSRGGTCSAAARATLSGAGSARWSTLPLGR